METCCLKLPGLPNPMKHSDVPGGISFCWGGLEALGTPGAASPAASMGQLPGCTVGRHSKPSRQALELTSHFRSFQFLTDLSLHPSLLPQPCHSPVSSRPFYTTAGPQCHSSVYSHPLYYSWTPGQDPELQSLLQEAPLLTCINEKAQKSPGYCKRDTLFSLSHLLPGYWHPQRDPEGRKASNTVSFTYHVSVCSKTALPSLWVKAL